MQPCYSPSIQIWVLEYRKDEKMERTKKFILKKYKKYFYSLKFVKKMPSERAKSFYFDRNKRNKNSQLSELEFANIPSNTCD